MRAAGGSCSTPTGNYQHWLELHGATQPASITGTNTDTLTRTITRTLTGTITLLPILLPNLSCIASTTTSSVLAYYSLWEFPV